MDYRVGHSVGPSKFTRIWHYHLTKVWPCIAQNKIIDYKSLTIDYVLLLYLPHLLDQTIYDTTLIIANVCYEHCPYYGRSGKDVIRGDYLFVSHGYRSHSGPRVHGNVGLYHLNSEWEAKEHAWRNIGDLIATDIWKYTDQFGSSIEKFLVINFLKWVVL